MKDCHSHIRACGFQSSRSPSWGDISVNGWGAPQRRLRGCSTGLAASAAVCHHCQVTARLPSSGSSQRWWETAAGHPKGSVWTTGQLLEGCCAHSLFLVPVSPSPHQSGLELQRPAESSHCCFSSTRAQRRDTAAAGASRPPPPASSTARSQTQPGRLSGSRCWAAPGKAPAASRPRVCVTADPAKAVQPPRPPAARDPTARSCCPGPRTRCLQGVKFLTGTRSPMGGGGSRGSAGVTHPALTPLACRSSL